MRAIGLALVALCSLKAAELLNDQAGLIPRCALWAFGVILAGLALIANALGV